jgi:hypothetical protein
VYIYRQYDFLGAAYMSRVKVGLALGRDGMCIYNEYICMAWALSKSGKNAIHNLKACNYIVLTCFYC